MNYHSDKWIMKQVQAHYDEATSDYFDWRRVVGIFNAGSANYGLDTIHSDVDTKLIVTPTFREIAMNEQPVSTTHVRDDDSHTDWKDIRLYCQTFRKANLNFLEILFTPYFKLNPMYAPQWNRLIEARETITHYDPVRGVRSMAGLAQRKYNNLEHESPAAMPFIEKFGYVPKELHHLLRIEEFIKRYIAGEKYEDCLISRIPEALKNIKNGLLNLGEARMVASNTITNINEMCEKFYEQEHPVDKSVNVLLDDVQYEIMKIAIKKEIGNET